MLWLLPHSVIFDKEIRASRGWWLAEVRSSASMNIDNEEGGECEAKNQFFFEARREFLLLLKIKERSAKIDNSKAAA